MSREVVRTPEGYKTFEQAGIGSVFDAFQLAGAQAIAGAGFTAIVLDTQRFALNPEFYTHVVGSAFVTVNREGRYRVAYDAGATITAPGLTSLAWVLGLNAAAVVGTFSVSLHATVANGFGSAHGEAFLDLVAGDIVNFYALPLAGVGTLVTLTQTCRLSLSYVSGAN